MRDMSTFQKPPLNYDGTDKPGMFHCGGDGGARETEARHVQGREGDVEMRGHTVASQQLERYASRLHRHIVPH